MATKNTIASATASKFGRPKGRKDSYARTRSEAASTFRIGYLDAAGDVCYVKRGMRKETYASFEAQEFNYKKVAVRVLNRLNARAKLAASGTKAAQVNKFSLYETEF